jgi:hypothetical protein
MSKIAHSGCQVDRIGFSRCPVFALEMKAKAWYSIDLCEDARPFAPTMSRGSRATQVNPEAFVILFRANP